MHEQDPFGDEHNGAWFLYAKGSGVWYNIGKSITFPEHADAFAHFKVHDNQAMCRAAAAAGFNTIQFTAHADHTNYPCDHAGKYPYMNIEIVAVKLQGTYACGSAGAPDFNVLRGGWADTPCACDNSIRFSNCGRALMDTAQAATEPASATQAVPADCSNSSAVAPPWFASCATDGACMQVTISSTIKSIYIASTTGANGTLTSGFDWCIDHTNAIVYAKLSAPPQGSVAFFKVADDVTQHSCAFLTHHWIDGDLLRVYELSGLQCTLNWTQLPVAGNITKGTLVVPTPPPLPPQLPPSPPPSPPPKQNTKW